VLAYRKDILEKHGIAAPVTYDQLLAACRAIREKEPGMFGITQRGQTGHQVTTGYMFHLTPHDGKLFDEDWKVAFTRPPAVAAAEMMKNLIDTGPPGIASNGFGEMLNAFLQGQTAFYLDSVTVFGPAQDAAKSRIAGKVGYAIHPKVARHAGSVGGFGIAMPSNARNKDAAFLFLQWITNKASDLRIATSGGNTMRWSTLDHPDARKVYPIEYPILKEALKVADLDWRPLIPEWDDISYRVLGIPLGEMVAGGRTPRDALASAVGEAENVVRKGGWLKA
jgi:multiple sugar transport system substrate-binding protein